MKSASAAVVGHCVTDSRLSNNPRLNATLITGKQFNNHLSVTATYDGLLMTADEQLSNSFLTVAVGHTGVTVNPRSTE